MGKPINVTDVEFSSSNLENSNPHMDFQEEPNDIKEEKETTEDNKPSIRKSGLRWVMLAFGCLFLMGSYFCYDNPAPV